MKVKNNSEEKTKLNRSGIRGILLWYLMVTSALLILLFCSGKFDWLNAWVYFIISILYLTILNLIAIKKNPEMLNERGKVFREGTKLFDKIFIVLWMPMILISMLIIAWDVIRFHWSYIPFWTLFIGIILTLPGFILSLTAMLSNPYFELTVRIQKDREQKVITSGPYKIVRHPGYAGEILNLVATPLILGSLWGFLPLGIIIVVFVIRTGLEDHTLRKELPGYKEYANKTRYRLIPYIW